MTRNVSRVLAVLAAYVILLVPLWTNGGPIYWPDSVAYLQGGGTALRAATGIETRYTQTEAATPEAATTDPGQEQEGPDPSGDTVPPAGAVAETDDRISSARSPYYAVFLTATSYLLGPAGPAYLQAFIAAVALVLLLRAVFPDRLPKAVILVFCGVALSTMGYFSAVLLPDILAPLGVLAIGVLFGFWSRLAAFDRIAWFVILIFSLISHNSHLAVAILVLVPAAIAARLIASQRILAPTVLVMAAIGIGTLGNLAFAELVERQYGYRPASFPMVAASLIVDAPGRNFLEQTCPDNGYVYCDHLDTQATEVDEYLWSFDPSVGVYMFADRATRDRMSEEQWAFLMDTLRADFFGQVAASFQRALRQVADNSVSQFAFGAGPALDDLPEPDRTIARESAMYNDRFPNAQISQLSQAVGWASVVALVFLLFRVNAAIRLNNDEPEASRLRGLLVLSLIVLFCFALNAGLTGAVSQPQGRYSARVFLLFPILVGLWLAFLWGRKGRNDDKV